MGQGLGILGGLITAFVITFLILTFGQLIPADLVHTSVVNDFLSRTDLELKLAVVSTVLFPGSLGSVNLYNFVGYGAQGGMVLTYLAWGAGGLVAGLLTRDIIQGIFASLLTVILAAFLTWLLVFFIASTDPFALISDVSMIILEVVLNSAIFPAIAAVIGGLLGGGITRER